MILSHSTAAAAAAARPPRMPNDWEDDRTPDDELYFPDDGQVCIAHCGARPNRDAGVVIRGRRNRSGRLPFAK